MQYGESRLNVIRWVMAALRCFGFLQKDRSLLNKTFDFYLPGV